jgi:hypothetical protein
MIEKQHKTQKGERGDKTQDKKELNRFEAWNC